MIVESIENGPYVRRMIATTGEPDLPVLVSKSFHEQTNEELIENDIKRTDADDQAIQTILLGLPENEKKAKLFNEWEKFTSTDRESIESYYHCFMQLMNDLKRNKHFPENIAANLKFLNNLQPEWKRHVTIVRQTNNLHEADFTQIYDFLKMNQDENGRNQNGLVVVPWIANQNGTGNIVAVRAKGTRNGNQARCYNCKGLGYIARNCTARPRRRDAAYFQTQLLIAQKEEAGIQLQAEEFDFMAAAGDLDEIEEVNANCILMANLQHASTSCTQLDKAPVYDTDGSTEVQFKDNCYDNEIFNMFTHKEQYTDLLKLIPEPQLVPQNDNHVTYGAPSMVQSLYNGNLLLEEHDPPTVYDLEETLELSQGSREKIRFLKKEIKPANYAKINHLSGVFVPQTTKSMEELFLLNVKNSPVTLQCVVKQKMTLEVHNWSSSAHKEVHKIISHEITPIINQVDARVQNFEIQFLQEAAKFVRDFISLAKEADESLDKQKSLELEIERLLKASVSRDIMSIVQNGFVNVPSDLQTEGECTLLELEGHSLKLSSVNALNSRANNMVYFVEGLGHNLFLVGQFCDADLEVAFRRNTCFIRDLDGVDLLKGNRSTNLYTINLYDMASASSICLMARTTPTKSWLWHQRLSHLNFDTINDLAKNADVSGLPKFKYAKEHICPSCKQGKSKRASHPPKHVLNSKKRLHLLYMDLCGPMRVKEYQENDKIRSKTGSVKKPGKVRSSYSG
uniref:Retrovirus-related Pol polyprotein from transposon TNT 1-94 n=1 Tax=Tanacetum cinerariifolium TaxID=118510 RepID=A0A6L2L3K6_TANCI|nr:retrovirus-related Pol polyprotein from transposon TNT 1-94 [Tanacetum cinerariifolium]